MKEDLTELVLDYREAMRQLWNNHARHYDFEHRFGAVEDEYFRNAVLYSAVNRIDMTKDQEHGFYDAIEIVPDYKSYLKVTLLGIPNESKGLDITRFEISEEQGLTIKFIGFYDFNIQGRRKYQYAKGYIVQTRTSEASVGNLIMLPVNECRYVNVQNA